MVTAVGMRSAETVEGLHKKLGQPRYGGFGRSSGLVTSNGSSSKGSGRSGVGRKRDKLRDKRMTVGEYSHGSLPMNCGPGLCWEGGGLGVPTSLFLAILVLALANSSLRVCGISGSNRTP